MEKIMIIITYRGVLGEWLIWLIASFVLNNFRFLENTFPFSKKAVWTGKVTLMDCEQHQRDKGSIKPKVMVVTALVRMNTVCGIPRDSAVVFRWYMFLSPGYWILTIKSTRPNLRLFWVWHLLFPLFRDSFCISYRSCLVTLSVEINSWNCKTDDILI